MSGEDTLPPSASRRGIPADDLRGEETSPFPGEFHAAWTKACRRLAGAGYGEAVSAAYLQASPSVARFAGPQRAIDMASVVSGLAIHAGRRSATLLPEAAIAAGRHLGEELGGWMRLIERTSRAAPDVTAALLERTDLLLSDLDLAGLESWVRIGIRSGDDDPARRIRFFRLEDPDAKRWLQRASGVVGFLDFEARLKPYLTALWGIRLPLREVPAGAPEAVKRRPGFDGAVIRMPAAYPGFSSNDTENLYRAAVAHIGAHCRFTREKFVPASLKPAQIALVSLIEDARVEQLAMRELPGLRRLFLPFHVASPTGPSTAPSLFARLARALADRDHEDPDGWVRKGRDAFFAAEWHDQLLSRRIGDLLGNDLGQMRIQFDARSYVVQPAYRDDNLGFWDFGDDQQQLLDAEQMLETARLKEEEDDKVPPDRNEADRGLEEPLGRLSAVEQERDGVLVARYPEFDYVSGRDRPEWASVREYQPRPGPAEMIASLREERADLVDRLTALIRSARVSRAERMHRQAEGDFLDIDACIDATIARRMGETPSTRIHGRYERRSRDLSTLLLLDVSQSTADKVRGSGRAVLDIERQAAALLAHAMAQLDDPFAIAAFSSDGREDVRYVRVKDFSRPFDRTADANLAGLRSGLSTRLGAAIRHAGSDLARQRSYRRLLLVVTDGEPSDVDVDDERYLVEDARKAVHGLNRMGIDTFCVGLDSEAASYLDRIFGPRNAVRIGAVDRLTDLLPKLYLTLTR